MINDNWVAVPDGEFCMSEDHIEVCMYVCVYVSIRDS